MRAQFVAALMVQLKITARLCLVPFIPIVQGLRGKKRKAVNEIIFAKNLDSSLSHVIGSVNGWINILRMHGLTAAVASFRWLA